MRMAFFPAFVAAFLCWAAVPLLADFTLVLKNGRRIIVRSYREEGSMIKIPALGGELGIPKSQIQSILKGADASEQGLSVPQLESSNRQASASTKEPSPTARDLKDAEGHGEGKPAAESEQENLQKRLAKVTRDLEAAEEQYFHATQGNGTSTNSTKEGYKALTADLMSRLKEKRGASDSEFEPQERELRDLRKEIDDLKKERDQLIQELEDRKTSNTSF